MGFFFFLLLPCLSPACSPLHPAALSLLAALKLLSRDTFSKWNHRTPLTVNTHCFFSVVHTLAFPTPCFPFEGDPRMPHCDWQSCPGRRGWENPHPHSPYFNDVSNGEQGAASMHLPHESKSAPRHQVTSFKESFPVKCS